MLQQESMQQTLIFVAIFQLYSVRSTSAETRRKEEEKGKIKANVWLFVHHVLLLFNVDHFCAYLKFHIFQNMFQMF